MATVDLKELVASTKPIVETTDSTVSVTVTPDDPSLLNQQFMFGLTVIDTAGNESIERTVTVLVVDTTRPLAQAAVLDVATKETLKQDVEKRFLVGSSAKGFILTAAGSVDPGGGEIKAYRWELKKV